MDYGTTIKSQWKLHIMEVSNYNLQRAYRATGGVTECNPYEPNYAQGGNDVEEPTGSHLEMDRTRRWITAGTGSRPDMDPDQRWIGAGNWLTEDGSLKDMDLDQIWMDDRRSMAGDGSREMDVNHSPFLYEASKIQSSTDLQRYGVPAAWFNRVRWQALLRALIRALMRDDQSCTYMPVFQCRIQSRIRSRVTTSMPIQHKPYKINIWLSIDL